MRRILHLLASPVFSGPAESVALLALEQRALGHQVSVAIDRKRGRLGSEEAAAPRLQQLGLLDDGGLELSVKSLPLALWSDLRRLRRREVDVVHAHFSHDHFLARLARPRGAVLIRSLHAPRSLRPSLPRADGYTAYAEEALADPRLRLGIRLPALVDPIFLPASNRGSLRQRLRLKGNPLVGMASTFQASRNHALALRAFARLRAERPEAQLLLLGDGPLQPVLEKTARDEGLEGAVTFAGYQQGEAFAERLRGLDELWVLGLGNDHAGRVAAQARASGVRVVGVLEGGLHELVDAPVRTLSEEGIVAASLGPDRPVPAHPRNEEIARAVLAFYEACRARR